MPEATPYYGILKKENPKMQTFVKCIPGDILSSGVIKITLWKDRLALRNFKYGVVSIKHTKMEHPTNIEDLIPIEKEVFEDVYKNSLEQF